VGRGERGRLGGAKRFKKQKAETKAGTQEMASCGGLKEGRGEVRGGVIIPNPQRGQRM